MSINECSDWEPEGERIYNPYTQNLALVTSGPYRGWLVARHVEGHWVTLINVEQLLSEGSNPPQPEGE